MNSSLRDQLLQAGLVTSKQAKQADREQQRSRSKHQPAQAPQQKVAAEQAQSAKLARDRELNRRQQEKAAAKARRAQIQQLVEQHRLPDIDSDEYFNFVDGHKLGRIRVDAQRREQLMQGTAVIVRYGNRYAAVPEAIAPRIREHDEHAIVPYNATPTAPEPDDPYKDFPVPDDLTW